MTSLRLTRLLAALALAGLVALAPAPAAAQSTRGGQYVVVQSGDTLDSIARRTRVPAHEIARANRMPSGARPTAGTRLFIPGGPAPTRVTTPRPISSPRPLIRTGATAPSPRPASTPAPRLAVPAQRPSSYTVQSGDSLWKIAQRFDVSVSDLARANGIDAGAWLSVGQVLRIPGPGADEGGWSGVAAGSPQVAGKSGNDSVARSGGWGSRGSGRFQWPVNGTLLGRFANSSTEKHYGIDIAAPKGSEVRAAAPGTVVYSGSTITAYGNMVIIQHDDGYSTCYAFNDRLLARVDQRVNAGDVIALSGDSGRRSEPYMHFQVRRNGRAVDPSPLLR